MTKLKDYLKFIFLEFQECYKIYTWLRFNGGLWVIYQNKDGFKICTIRTLGVKEGFAESVIRKDLVAKIEFLATQIEKEGFQEPFENI